MADNVTIDPGATPSAPIRTDDVGGVHYQVVKLDVGGDGVSTPVVGTLPVSDGGGSITVDGDVGVSGSVEVVNDVGNPLPVNGTVTAAVGTGATDLGKTRDVPAGAADVGVLMMAVRNDTVGTLVSASGDYTPLQTGPNGRLRVLPASEYKIAATGNLTAAAQTVAGVVDEYGTCLISVSGTYASAVLVFEGFDGANWVGMQSVRSDANVVETAPAALTNTTRAWEAACHAFSQVRVRCVSIVSGTVAVRISASGAAIEPVPAAQVPAAIEQTGTLAALNAVVTFPIQGQAGVMMQASGTFVATLSIQISTDGGTNYNNGVGVPVGGGNATGSIAAAAQVYIPTAGVTHVRIQATAYTSGTATVTMRAAHVGSAVGIVGGTIGQVSSIVPGTAATNLGKAEDAAAASGDTGVFVLGVRRDTVTAAPASATGDYSEIVVGADGQQGVRIVPSSVTTGAPTRHRAVSAATTNATSVKASAGRLYSLRVSNSNAAARYLKLFDKASAPTVGTDVPILTIPIPPTSGFVQLAHTDLQPEDFTLGIAYAITGAQADADATAVGAGDVIVQIRYL